MAVALVMRQGGADDDLVQRLTDDPRLPLDRVALDALPADWLPFTGVAGTQVAAVAAAVDQLVARHPDAARYAPAPIL